jgi:hypothetical protein
MTRYNEAQAVQFFAVWLRALRAVTIAFSRACEREHVLAAADESWPEQSPDGGWVVVKVKGSVGRA